MAKAKKPVTKKTGGTKPAASGASRLSDAKTAIAEAERASAEKKSDTVKAGSAKPGVKKPLEASEPMDTPKETVAKEAASKPTESQEQKSKTTGSPENKSAVAQISKSKESVSNQDPAPENQGSGFFPLLLGGAVAAVLGFLASEMNLLGFRSGSVDPVELATLRDEVERHQSKIALLESAGPAKSEVGEEEVAKLREQLSALSDDVLTLDGRMTVIEKQPISGGGASGAAVAAYERELAALQDAVKSQRGEIEGLLENALSVKEATAQQSALTGIAAAMNTGSKFTAEIDALRQAGAKHIPEQLTSVADVGVVTMTNLQSRYPDAARAALQAARDVSVDETEKGFGGFLRRQLGARSVTPREGSDPDAVLSRTEVAVRDGQLVQALTEIDALPAVAKEAMADWLTDAQARRDAEQAIKKLSTQLAAN